MTFAPNQATKVITISVKGDTLRESDEFFSVVLSNSGIRLTILGSALGTIANDDQVTV